MTSAFEEQINDPNRGYAIDDQGTSIAMVAFGGIKGGLHMPPFEFFGLARDFPVTKVFIRDIGQSWYSDGVEGLGADLESTARGLGALAAERGFTPVLFGVSAGGFAALATSAFIPTAGVHAFSPQTTLRRFDRFVIRDRRWRPNVARLRKVSGRVEDVKPLLSSSDGSERHVYVSSQHQLDLKHARRLGGNQGVELHEYGFGGHGVVKELRDRGELLPIIESALRSGADAD